MTGSAVPRDPNLPPEMRRFLDGLSRNIFNGLTATEATALLDVFTSTLDGLAPASGGGSTNFLRADGTWASPATGLPAGTILQVLQNQYTTNTDIATAIPLDDSTPLIGEGTEVLTKAITVAATANSVRAQVVVNGAVSNASTAMIVALFRGSTCIDAKPHTFTTQNFPATITMDVLDAPATAGSVTYSVRVGPSANTLRLNGSTTSRIFGGTSKCTLTVSEIKG